MICNKCFIDKPSTEFFVETKKDTGKQYQKKYCNDCFRAQARAWKAKNRLPKRVKKDPMQDNPDYKQCRTCNKWKHRVDEYYSGKAGHIHPDCRECSSILEKEKRDAEREQHLKDYGGSERCKVKPNDWTDDYQREHVHGFLYAIGWKFDNGIWWKEGFKTPDGKWIKYGTTPTQKKRKRQGIFKYED